MVEAFRVDKVRPHEMFNVNRLAEVIQEILTTGKIYPIIVDKKTKIVIDGSHRLAAAKYLGRTHIPVKFVDMFAKEIVLTWRNTDTHGELTKKDIVAMVKKGGIFPAKSTRFFFQKEDGELVRLYEAEPF